MLWRHTYNNLFWTFENFNVIVPLSPLPASVHVTLSGCVTVRRFCWLSVAFCQYNYHYSWLKFWPQPCSGDSCKIPITRCKGRIILHLPFSVPPPVCPELKSLHNLCFENSLVDKMYTNMFGFQTSNLFIKVSLFCQINAIFCWNNNIPGHLQLNTHF